MIYLYDNAIVDDLVQSLNPDNTSDLVVTAVNGENFLGIAAQKQSDALKFPLICVKRGEDTNIDNARTNFTRSHVGVPGVFDSKNNNIYYEKVLPINLTYTLCIYATSQADLDELVRELAFKYIQMYFLTVTLPYESKRKVRFGVSLDPDAEITQMSGSSNYLEGGTLYEADIHLRCDGCVLVTYTPSKLRRYEYETETH